MSSSSEEHKKFDFSGILPLLKHDGFEGKLVIFIRTNNEEHTILFKEFALSPKFMKTGWYWSTMNPYNNDRTERVILELCCINELKDETVVFVLRNLLPFGVLYNGKLDFKSTIEENLEKLKESVEPSEKVMNSSILSDMSEDNDYKRLKEYTNDLWIQGRGKNAIMILNSAILIKPLSPNNFYLFFQMSRIKRYLGRFDEALSDIEEALHLHTESSNNRLIGPSNPRSTLKKHQGTILLQMGRDDQAFEVLSESKRLNFSARFELFHQVNIGKEIGASEEQKKNFYRLINRKGDPKDLRRIAEDYIREEDTAYQLSQRKQLQSASNTEERRMAMQMPNASISHLDPEKRVLLMAMSKVIHKNQKENSSKYP